MLHVLLVVTAAIALQTKPVDTRAEHARRTTIVVGDDDVIEASPYGPKDHVVEAPQKRRAFWSLIHMRTSFAREMLQSAAQVGGK